MKFTSQSVAEHLEVPLADEGRLEEVVAHWQARHPPATPRDPHGTACYVVSVHLAGEHGHPDAKLEEILGLVRTQGDRVVGHEKHRLANVHPRTFVGRGVAEQIASRAMASGAAMLVLDAELSPSQLRNLEDAAGLPVCDREAVILNVFLRHAKTRSARIQVEIAQLEYLRPRIRGLGLDMDQQTGGNLKARGPGETASELMARRLDGRLADLRRARSRLGVATDIRQRGRSDCQRVALVGYTNAGKTTLMNALTHADLDARGVVFETLDTTSRCLTRHGGDILLSDTVGFIRRLPERLLASFASTLSEVVHASLIAVVIDVSDEEWPLHVRTTCDVLDKLGAGAVPRLYVFNKLDRATQPPNPDELREWAGEHHVMAMSSHDAGAVAELQRLLIQLARSEHEVARVFVAYDAADMMALVYARCRVLATEAKPRGLRLTIEAEPHTIARLRRAGRRTA